ncbi:MAG: PAS domain S-box protein [Patescibacteria group bacterium]|jgi:PAS domain S-box-containing protein|nr:PAS domain S-box protein [Patescibacteria group bacterium]
MHKFSKKALYSLIAVLAVIFILAVVGIMSLSKKIVINDFNKELNLSSEIVSSVINPERIKNGSKLIGDREAILQHEDVAWLKGEVEGLGDIFLSSGVDAIYLLVRRGNNIYFLAESTPYGEEAYIEPGSLYKNPPMEAFEVFDKKTALFSEVYTNSYGTYFSKFTPIFDENNQIVGVLGADIEYSYFASNLKEVRIILILLLIIIFSIIYFVIFYIRKKEIVLQKVEDNKEKITSLINSFPYGLVVYDKNEVIDLWNQTAKKMFGYKSEEVKEKKISEVIKYDKVFKSNSNKEIKDFEFFSKKNQSSRKVEFRIKNEDSTINVIEVLFNYMNIDEKIFSIALFEDISARKLKEFEIERQRNKLEKLNSLMVDRELKMVELKNKLAKLKNEEGEEGEEGGSEKDKKEN